MARELTQLELLKELAPPVAEENVNRHLKTAKDWNPHDYVPWDEGRNFAALGGVDYDPPEQSQLDEVAKAAMITNLLTEDNLPSYHRVIADNFSMDSAWGGHWVGRWTAEENRHGIVMRDYLVVTRGVDPVALEEARMIHMTNGYDPMLATAGRVDELEEHADELGLLHSVAYVTFQELATRVSHRNTGKACKDPIADKMLQRIAADENLHMIFYRNICGAGFDISPRPDAARGHRHRDQLPDARRRNAELPPPRRPDGQARHLRPSPAPRRGRHAGSAQVERLRARRLHRRGREDP